MPSEIWREATPADSADVARDVAVALAYKVITARFAVPAFAALLGAGVGSIVTRVVMRRRNP